MNYIQLGKWLKNRRLALGMTQKAVAEKAGVSRQWYNQFENGRGINLYTQTLEKIYNALDLDFPLFKGIPEEIEEKKAV